MTDAEMALFGIEKLNVARSEIPAVTHVDYSARVQTVHRETNPRFHALISAFKARTGCPVLVNTSFNVRGELLEAAHEDLFEQDPRSILEAFLLMQQHQELRGMTAMTQRALWRARTHINAKFRRDAMGRLLFLMLLQQPRGIVHELRRMNQYGVLGRYLPEFGRIVGQMQHDLFHVYTVDQHILMVVRNLRRFTMPELAHEFPGYVLIDRQPGLREFQIDRTLRATCQQQTQCSQ